MANNTMHDILDAKDKHLTKTYGANGVLSRFWRQILLDLNITGSEFTTLLHNHIINPINRVVDNRKAQISYRGNLTKELAKPQMTWKVFMKALRFLNIVNIDITLNAYHYNGSITTHKTNFSLGGRHNEAKFYKELEQPEEVEAVQRVYYLDYPNEELYFDRINKGEDIEVIESELNKGISQHVTIN